MINFMSLLWVTKGISFFSDRDKFLHPSYISEFSYKISEGIFQ